VRSAQDGSSEAAAKLYRDHFPFVYGYLLRTLKSPPDAEDACQHVFLKVFSGGAPLDDEVSFNRWLVRVAHNHAIDRLRAARRAADPLDPHRLDALPARALAEDSPDDEATQETRMREMLQDLPPAQQEALVLIYLHDMRAVEAAVRLRKTPEAVRQLHRRALAALATAGVG
jgi:RNA polymerase sigma factor (sigma-70 family)